MSASKHEFFKPEKSTAVKKADLVDTAARGIIAQEAAARDKKTEKLRALRLAKEAAEPAPVPKKKRQR